MFERLDKQVKAVLTVLPQEAAASGATTIEPEHMLMALASAPNTPAGGLLGRHGVGRSQVVQALQKASAGFTDEDEQALAAVGIDLAAITEAADRTFGQGALSGAGVRAPRGGPRFSEAAKSVLAGAVQECLLEQAKTVTTLHLLLALARDSRLSSSALLSGWGLDYDVIRRESSQAA
ncbi:MAG TPA: Clp protease N-terminal domain-containing protein [Acidimicrobiales bacterium]|nr:Clp protease N-terminal domain-containing protein [Acidimicrobiales bacterium]